jgi:iron complex outermembrane receptor protein
MPISTQVDGYLRGLASIYGDSQNDPANNLDDVPAYALVNLYAGIRDPRGYWDVGFFVKNLFNAERVLSRNANAYSVSYTNVTNAFVGQPRGVTGVSDYRGITMTPPREFGLNVRYSFGAR